MPNIDVKKVIAKPADVYIAGTSSGAALGFNFLRQGLTLTNISQAFISLSFGGTAAVIYTGITLVPNGGTWSMDDFSFTDEIVNAVASAASSTLVIQEFVGA